jgi:hypothetical protein
MVIDVSVIGFIAIMVVHNSIGHCIPNIVHYEMTMLLPKFGNFTSKCNSVTSQCFNNVLRAITIKSDNVS